MIVLALLPLPPLAAALWLALSGRAASAAAGHAVVIIAVLTVAAAIALPDGEIRIPALLVPGGARLALDDLSRAGLALFGGLWLAAGLMARRAGEQKRVAIAALVTLSAAIALALAVDGPVVYTALAALGYGAYATASAADPPGWRRAGRVFVVMLVISDLLIFEALLEAVAHPDEASGPAALLPALAALVLRSGAAPAHAWLPFALRAAPAPGALLMVAVPAGALFLGAARLVPGGAGEWQGIALLLAFAGSTWSAAAGLAQARSGASLGYAVSAAASLLLLVAATGKGSAAPVPWLMLATLVAVAALPLAATFERGPVRKVLVALVVLAQGCAGGALARTATSGMSPAWVACGALAAVAAAALLVVSARRAPAAEVAPSTAGPATAVLLVLAGAGLAIASFNGGAVLGALWVGPAALVAGWLGHRVLLAGRMPVIEPGDRLGRVEAPLARILLAARRFCLDRLPLIPLTAQAVLRNAWDGKAWSRRLERAELTLRTWSIMWLLLLAFGLAAAWLLTR